MKSGSNSGNKSVKTGSVIKFAIFSLVGLLLFLTPIPTEDAFNIPLGIAIDWLGTFLAGNEVSFFGLFSFTPIWNFNVGTLLAYIFISVSFLGTLVAYIAKPGFIMNNPKLKSTFYTHPFYAVCRLVAFVLATIVFLHSFPQTSVFYGTALEENTIITTITASWLGGLMLNELITGLVAIFLILAFVIPILTDFGLMEFIGVLIKKVVRVLFTLPGRAAIDLAASWFGSSAVSVIITRNQHEKGFYTAREAAAIAVNFSFVSLPFSFVVARTMGIEQHFYIWYLIICITCILLAMITPRIWPLKGLKDEYLEGVGKQIDEDDTPGVSRLAKAMDMAGKRAENSKASGIVSGGLKCYLDVFMDLLPMIMALGTIALIVEDRTPVFEWVSYPMAWMLDFLQVQGGSAYASTTVVGFVDMFIPALMLRGAYLETRFILGALSIVQIIYMAETGILIIKSKMPLGFVKLLALFFIRTIIALPIIVWLTRIFMNFY